MRWRSWITILHQILLWPLIFRLLTYNSCHQLISYSHNLWINVYLLRDFCRVTFCLFFYVMSGLLDTFGQFISVLLQFGLIVLLWNNQQCILYFLVLGFVLVSPFTHLIFYRNKQNKMWCNNRSTDQRWNFK